jgi:hypothetical protein
LSSPSVVVARSTIAIVVARSTIAIVVAAGDYVRAKTPLRSVFALTSIAPTHAAIASVAKSPLRCRRHPLSSPPHPDDRTHRGASVHCIVGVLTFPSHIASFVSPFHKKI